MAPPVDRVALWFVRTSELTDAATLDAVRRLLTPEEQRKHQAFRFDRHRHEYLATRAIERAVLATCVGCTAAELAFARTEYGRPELVPRTRLRWNLTNTVQLVACAVALERELGVDAEPLSRGDDVLEIAGTVFTEAERAMLAALELPARRRRAIELWTLKEAYMKARGLGMSLPVKEFAIAFEGDAPAGLLLAPTIADDPARWSLATLEIGDHLVSLCVEARPGALAIDVEPADVAAMLAASAAPRS